MKCLRVVLAAVILGVAFLLLSGCGIVSQSQPPSRDSFVGSWTQQASFEPEKWTFFKDGTWTRVYGSSEHQGTYEITSLHDKPAVTISWDTGENRTYFFERDGANLLLGTDEAWLAKAKAGEYSPFDAYVFVPAGSVGQ